MKINKVHRGSISGIEAYFIEYEGGGVFVQRAAPTSASDNPLSNTEEIICALSDVCEERDRYKADSEALDWLMEKFGYTINGIMKLAGKSSYSDCPEHLRKRLEGMR